MSRTAVTFPGQGAQKVGMGRDVADACAEARAVFDQANDVLGYDLATICFEGPQDRLEATDVQQPAILVTSVALWQAARSAGLDLSPEATAGLSLGEYTALHVAGSLSFADAVRLVQTRGRLMQEAAEACPSGMVSLLGAEEEQADALCRQASAAGIIQPANFNCPGQIVLSGASAACDRVVDLASEIGCQATRLKVAGAFHSELMRSAAEGLQIALAETEILPPKIPVVSNVTGDYHGEPDSIRQRLYEQVCQPVRWQASVERLIADGFDRFLEIGPGRVLTGLMRRIDRKKTAVNISDASSLASLSAA